MPISVEDMWSRLKERGIPLLWLPAKTAFFPVEELPVLGSGKLDLKGIKRIAHEKMGV
jgi:acyl-[acyl-carrier-protein]-phospholipid O-acyltransferase/long-chain-fatty-acid--[acyl-carrier-protein] ligase